MDERRITRRFRTRDRGSFLGDALHQHHDPALTGGVVGMPRLGDDFLYTAHVLLRNVCLVDVGPGPKL